ncbi:hypothetical protein D1007_16047 [Hordeum vulgare]|uniref:Predicted protein n=1 Tax=Hordeum vulgare subsp. vulgare TaxID=112509 RepID=F2E0I2_HORVV|nr:uncharacterized protein LOC123407574 [Hordeum vulgare subsp. vulgare]KAE8807668.1 hypothetical protein D1007_16047 [Hordeum vulgare]BAK00854.1 predicted protein [Hordeum vulgare subsp. vulgare]
MSCFAVHTSSSSRISGSRQPWRWWRKCAGLAAAAHTKLRRTVLRVRWSATGRLGGHRRRAPAPPLPSVQRGDHMSFAPVYVDELYSQPKGLSVVHEEQPSTSKPSRPAGGANKARVHGVAAATGARGAAVAAKSLGVRGFLLSPGRGGVGMGEVDLRAEMFIRNFREEMRLQSQRSAEELQAMLARGL